MATCTLEVTLTRLATSMDSSSDKYQHLALWLSTRGGERMRLAQHAL